MLKHVLLSSALIVASASTSFAMTDAECTTLWNRSDVYASGKLTPAYAQAVAKSGKAIAPDGTIDQATFMDACKGDAFKTMAVAATTPMTTEPGAPFPGANSFTEAQATGRIEKAGFTGVTGLKKDDQGIWRGTAMQGGKSMSVALDFKGNVVAK